MPVLPYAATRCVLPCCRRACSFYEHPELPAWRFTWLPGTFGTLPPAFFPSTACCASRSSLNNATLCHGDADRASSASTANATISDRFISSATLPPGSWDSSWRSHAFFFAIRGAEHLRRSIVSATVVTTPAVRTGACVIYRRHLPRRAIAVNPMLTQDMRCRHLVTASPITLLAIHYPRILSRLTLRTPALRRAPHTHSIASTPTYILPVWRGWCHTTDVPAFLARRSSRYALIDKHSTIACHSRYAANFHFNAMTIRRRTRMPWRAVTVLVRRMRQNFTTGG